MSLDAHVSSARTFERKGLIEMAFSPPPPPQAARAFVRQIFGRRGAGPRVSATVLDEPGMRTSVIEFVNEGDQAERVQCLIRSDAVSQELTVGNLAPGSSTTAELHEPVGRNLTCVWTAFDTKGRLHLWSYQGEHKRLRRGHEVDLPTALERMYPD